MILKADFMRRKAEGLAEPVLRRSIARVLRQERGIELRERRAAIARLHADAQHAGRGFQHHQRIAFFAHLLPHPRPRQVNRRADGRVTGEGQFHLRREDSHRGRMRRALRRQQENGLRQVEFTSDGLHGLRVQA
jgi:hypothetical protein